MDVANTVCLARERARHFRRSIDLQRRTGVRRTDVLEDDGRRAIDYGAASVAGRVDHVDGARSASWSEVDTDADVDADDLL